MTDSIIYVKFPDLVAWTPAKDITAAELARAIPVIFAMYNSYTSADDVRALEPDVARHFTITPNPKNK